MYDVIDLLLKYCQILINVLEIYNKQTKSSNEKITNYQGDEPSKINIILYDTTFGLNISLLEEQKYSKMYGFLN